MKIFIVILSTLTILIGPDAFGERREFKKFTTRKYGKRTIEVRQKRPRGSINGSLPSKKSLSPAVKKFFDALDKLPENFIKRTGLKYVTFLDDPTLNNESVGGIATGNTIFLNTRFSEKTVYHELFHIFDSDRDVKKWRKLNDRDFVYTGSVYYELKVSRKKTKRRQQNLSSGKYSSDFVSRYAMSNAREDRAETFAYMIVEGNKFLKRTRKSPVLHSKMKFIIDMTDKKKLLGEKFWQDVLGIQDLSKL